jgi:AcrR family transcriptional regulator
MTVRQRTRTIKTADQRRADLLEAAERVVVSKGLDRATVQDITQAAGASKGTFYVYFDSKEDLLDALRVRLSEAFREQLARLRIPRGGGWRAFTDRLVREAIELMIKHHDLHELLVHRPHRHEDPLASSLAATYAALGEIIEAGRKAGAYHVSDAARAAEMVSDLVHAAAERACAEPRQAKRVTKSAVELVRRALMAPVSV